MSSNARLKTAANTPEIAMNTFKINSSSSETIPVRRLSRLTNQANRPRADGAPAPPASGPVERVVRAARFTQPLTTRADSSPPPSAACVQLRMEHGDLAPTLEACGPTHPEARQTSLG